MSVGGVFSQMALTQLNLSMKMLKVDAEANQQMANVLSELVDQAAANASRGNNLNIKV